MTGTKLFKTYTEGLERLDAMQEWPNAVLVGWDSKLCLRVGAIYPKADRWFISVGDGRTLQEDGCFQ